MSTLTSALKDAVSSIFDDASDGSIQTEQLPPLSFQHNIPGTNIPDLGVPEGGYPNSHNHYSPEGYNPDNYAHSDPGIFAIPDNVNPFIDPKMERSSISVFKNPSPRIPLL